MRVSNGYFRHPITGEMIRPGEMYAETCLKNAEGVEGTSLPETEATGCMDVAGGNGFSEENILEETERSPAADTYSPKVKKLNGHVEEKPLSELTVAELKVMALKAAIEGFSGMRKAELINALECLGDSCNGEGVEV